MVNPHAIVPVLVAQHGGPGNNDLHGSRWSKMLVSKWLALLGVLYVGGSLYGSARFLVTATVYLSNDMFWPSFNAVYVAIACNRLLMGQTNATGVSLTDPRFVIASGTPVASMSISSSQHYPRLLQYDRMTSIEDGVVGLRTVPADSLMDIVSQYCWVDFGRRWSLAHTEQRAERCRDNYADNAAVYLEATLRNVDWEQFYTVMSGWFEPGIGNELARTDEGLKFLDSVKQNATTSIEEEAALWRHNGVTHYTLSYHTMWQLGLSESVDLVTALNYRTQFRIKEILYENRWSAYTSMKMFWTMTNNLWAIDPAGNTAVANCSLIRNASNFYERQNITMEDVLKNDAQFPWPLTPTDKLFRAAVGPFGSIDMTWIGIPQELTELVDVVRRTVFTISKENADFRADFRDVSSSPTLVQFFPRSWANETWRFVGGSPLCSTSFDVTYPIQQFRFDDVCARPLDEAKWVDSFAFVFTALTSGVDLTHNLTDQCLDVTNDPGPCADGLGRAQSLIQGYLGIDQRDHIARLAFNVRRRIEQLNVSFFQVVAKPQPDNSRRYALEVEPIVSEDLTSGRNIYGMFFLLEWVTGFREVVMFEGDHGAMTLISALSNGKLRVAADLPNTMAPYLWIIMWLITLVLMIVAALVLLYSVRTRLHVSGLNLLEFNRVSGVSWIGRPVLALRGIVALCILSSSTLTFTTDGYFNWMEEQNVPWFIKILAAGETTWLLCVAIDLLLIYTHGHVHVVAPTSHGLSWIIVALLQLIAPTVHKAEFEQQCQFVQMEQEIQCKSGTITIGSASRLCVILLISLGSLGFCYLIARASCRQQLRREDTALLPPIAREVFSSTGWLHGEDWHLDPASAVIAGMISWKSGPHTKVMDVKTWTVFCNEDVKTHSALPRRLERTIRLRDLKVHCEKPYA